MFPHMLFRMILLRCNPTLSGRLKQLPNYECTNVKYTDNKYCHQPLCYVLCIDILKKPIYQWSFVMIFFRSGRHHDIPANEYVCSAKIQLLAPAHGRRPPSEWRLVSVSTCVTRLCGVLFAQHWPAIHSI